MRVRVNYMVVAVIVIVVATVRILRIDEGAIVYFTFFCDLVVATN